MKLKLPKESIFLGPPPLLRRVLAFLVDLLVIDLVIISPFRGILQKIVPKGGSDAYNFLISNPGYGRTLSLIMLIIGILSVLYFALLEYKFSQSIGKMLFGLFVKSELKQKRLWQYAVRSMFLLMIFPFILLLILDPVFMFFTKTNQRLSEILSKTRTVQSYLMGNNI